MNENQGGSGNLLDTTDCLEAVGVFKGWKNFFFIIAIVCIGILQACFWLVDLGMIPISPSASGQVSAPNPEVPQGNIPGTLTSTEPNATEGQMAPSEPNETPTQTTPEVDETTPAPEIVEPNQPAESNEPVAQNLPILLVAQETVASPNEPGGTGEKEFLFGVEFRHVEWIIRFVDAILILIAFLYCLTMLFSLKISIIGRLGGINHITRAFFLSLILLILVLPWQLVFNDSVMGAIFTSGEIVKWYGAKTGEMLDMILYYLRFCGYMVLVLLLLILAQIRSARWAKAILRRLEII